MTNTNSAKIQNIYAKLQEARMLVQGKNIKKSGYNGYAKFHYYELADFMPIVNQVFHDLRLTSCFIVLENRAELRIYNAEKPDESMVFTSTLPEMRESKGRDPLQNIVAVHTYLKRYLYMNAMEIVENDAVDGLLKSQNEEQNDNNQEPATTHPQNQEPRTVSTQIQSCPNNATFKAILTACENIDDLNVWVKRKAFLTVDQKQMLHKKALALHAKFSETAGLYTILAA